MGRLFPFHYSALAFVSVLGCLAQEPQPELREKARSLLRTAISAKNPDTRIKAVQAASIIGPQEEVLSTLAQALEIERDVPAKLAIIDCLASFKDEALTSPMLEKALKDETPEVVLAAAKVLYSFHRESGKDVLFSILIGEEKASSSFITSQKRDYLRMLTTPKKLMLTAATMAPVPYIGLGLTSAQGILNDPAGSARAGIILAVIADEDPALRKAIKAALNDKEWSVRAAAIHSLAFRNDPSLKTDIAELMDDKNEKVRLRAAAAYLRLDTLP